MSKDTKLTLIAIVITTVICSGLTINRFANKQSSSLAKTESSVRLDHEQKVQAWSKEVEDWKKKLSETKQAELTTADISVLPNTGPSSESD